MNKMAGRKRVVAVLSFWTLLGVFYLTYNSTTPVDQDKRFVIIENSSETTELRIPLLQNSKTNDTNPCQGFNIDPDDPTVAKYIKKYPPISCKGLPSILYAEKYSNENQMAAIFVLKVNKTKTALLNIVHDYCTYRSLKMREGNDFKVNISAFSEKFTESIPLPEHVDHVYAFCKYKEELVSVTYITLVRKKPDVEEQLKKDLKTHMEKVKPKEILNFMLIGIDGMSKPNFVRHFPKTKKFLVDEMGAIELYRVNKIGLNTFPNVVPMLTGLNGKNLSKLTVQYFMDKIDHLFLWDKALKAGYRTGVVLDHDEMTSFHYLKKGWNHPKFHYYNRPIVVQTKNDVSVGKSPCVGDTPEIKLFLDHYIEIARLYNNTKDTPYFLYAFMCALTHHRLNPDRSGDDVYRGILQTFHEENLFHNTVLVFFSDHGTRMGPYRSTIKGMLEDSNPFMFFVFPPWFKEKYPKLMATFRMNQNTVITAFDIHETLKDMLYFQGEKEIVNRLIPKNKTQGISLFQNIPARTCNEAGIPLEFCNCRKFGDDKKIAWDSLILLKRKLMETIIDRTKQFRDKCVVLRLNSTISTLNLIVPNNNVRYYLMTIRTSPGGAIYQATIHKRNNDKKGDTIKVGDQIDRLNLYRGQANCVDSSIVRPFCFCADMLTASGEEKDIDQSEDAEFGKKKKV